MNGKTTDETEVILPFEGRSQSLAYQKQFQAVLRISQTLKISRKIMKICTKTFSNGDIKKLGKKLEVLAVGTLCPKISFLAQKLRAVAREHTHTHTDRESKT